MSDDKGGKGRGCLFYGCLTLVVLFVVSIVGVYFGAKYALNKAVEAYTSTQPAALPKVAVSEDAFTVLQKRVADFSAAVKNPTNAVAITLTSDEINALIARDPSFSGFNNKLHVAIEGNQIKSTVSWPLDELGVEKLKGRYANGSASLKAVLANGELIVNLDSLTVNGKTLPASFMQGMRGENLAKEMNKDPKQAEFIRKFESIEIKDGKLTIKVKGKEAPAGGEK